MSKHRCFQAESKQNAEILVLGSMPGMKSLQVQQYYAHPQNLFWHIMSLAFDIDPGDRYVDRIKALKANKIALWDVIGQCEREGSLDTNINNEEVNDIAGFLSRHKQIKKICFNGKKAYASFRKYILRGNSSIAEKYELIVLPSTSPANASIPKDVKIALWLDALSRH